MRRTKTILGAVALMVSFAAPATANDHRDWDDRHDDDSCWFSSA